MIQVLSNAVKNEVETWLHVARGAVQANGARLSVGDGAAIEDQMRIVLGAIEDSEVLLFDLP